MAAGSMNVIKYLMFFFNYLFWFSGVTLITVGSIVRYKYGDYLSYADNSYANVAVFLITIGVISFAVGFLGYYGPRKDNVCMVTTFKVLLGIIFILEIIAGLIAIASLIKVEVKATDAIARAVENYHNIEDEGAKRLMDWAQPQFKCCGSKSKKYSTHPVYCTCTDNSPESCHTNKTCSSAKYHRTCEEGFTGLLKVNLIVIGAFALVIGFVQIVGVVVGSCLMKSIKKEYEVL